MRSATDATVLAAALGLALTACGNYSTEDLRFLVALPTRTDLRVATPAQTTGALTVCGSLGPANVWLRAKPTSDGLNSSVSFVISLVDAVRSHPPTEREDDLRRWGPFPDQKHPGHDIQIVITRSYPSGPDGPPLHAYSFQAREGAGPFLDIITGSFVGASSSRGSGSVTLDFEAFYTLHMEDASTPHGTMQIGYDRVTDPTTIDLVLTNDGFGVVQFGYAFAGYQDGRGAFRYRFRNAGGDVFTVATGYDASGAGRDSVTYTAFGGATGSFRQCWDASACLSYVDDPSNFSCPGPGACSGGSIGLCPAVPVFVF